MLQNEKKIEILNEAKRLANSTLVPTTQLLAQKLNTSLYQLNNIGKKFPQEWKCIKEKIRANKKQLQDVMSSFENDTLKTPIVHYRNLKQNEETGLATLYIRSVENTGLHFLSLNNDNKLSECLIKKKSQKNVQKKNVLVFPGDSIYRAKIYTTPRGKKIVFKHLTIMNTHITDNTKIKYIHIIDSKESLNTLDERYKDFINNFLNTAHITF